MSIKRKSSIINMLNYLYLNKFQQSGVLLRDTSSKQIANLCYLSQIVDEVQSIKGMI